LNYQVLARKWRPRTFAQVVGQGHVLQALINALDNNRLHHAYLFTGTRGVGKTSLGRIFAKSINCESSISSTPCGSCSSCLEIDEGRFVDLIEVDAASRTKVEETRDLLENVQYAPTRARFKVYLIDEVHMLTSHSFNALLKTLEEPPPHVKFILATTDPQKLPVTILSRCLKFNLKVIPISSSVDHMRYILGEEKIEFDDIALKRIAQSARGSMRDALSLLDQAIAHGNGIVSDQSVKDMLGSIDKNDINSILEGLVDSDPTKLLDSVANLASNGALFDSVLSELISSLHQIALAQLLPSALDDDLQDLLEFSKKISAEDVQLYYQIALTGQKDLPLAPDPRSGFEMVLIRMYAFKPMGTKSNANNISRTPAEVKHVDDSNFTKKANYSVESKQVLEESDKPRQINNPTEKAATNWDGVVNQLPLTGIPKQIISNCLFKQKENNRVELIVDGNSQNMITDAITKRIETALSQHYSEEIKVCWSNDLMGQAEETPAKKKARKHKAALNDAIHSMEKDPNIIEMQETFNATLDPNSVQLLDEK